MSRRKIQRGEAKKVTIQYDGKNRVGQHEAQRGDADYTSKTRSYIRVRSTQPESGNGK